MKSGSASPAQSPQPSPAHTVDVFHRGAFVLVQPAASGHRAGMDAMMLAAAVPSNFTGRLADLGSGAGAAGLAVAARCPGARVVLVENAPEMADLARLTAAHEANAALASRLEVIEADVTLSGAARAAEGLTDNGFDFALMNPPFNSEAHRASPDTLRRQAHMMDDDLFERWTRTAAA
ncbi:MAG: methyltransferase, partial [Rhizobiaceae bacterium]|nr:methyltransferase [Rhizobiaceae bacterium]